MLMSFLQRARPLPLRERLGFLPDDVSTGGFWMHAVSVGEMRLALRILPELRRRFPGAPVHVSTGTPTGRALAQLQTLRAIGPIGSWTLATEIFGWRQIRNGRQLGALVGLVPSPYQSGETHYEQGITRAGNKHVRRIMVQLAWRWLYYQPDSALSKWYQHRFAGNGTRMRRIGIVALARKLLVAVWRYLETGVVPEGAHLKAAEV